MFISHRMKTESSWYDRELFKATLEKSAFTSGLRVRHNMSDRSIEYMEDYDLSKTLLFHTKRGFPYYKMIAPITKKAKSSGLHVQTYK